MSPNPSDPATNSTSGKKINVLLVDDHTLVRQGLRMFIDMQDDMVVVAEGSTGAEAIELASRYVPDVILMDLIMPVMDGVEATQAIMANNPKSCVLVLTSFIDDDKVFPAIRAGAQGYLLKDIQPRDLVQAIRDAFQGKAQLHPTVSRRLMDAVSTIETGRAMKPGARDRELESLTEREREVLDMIARGMSNREIAKKMVISEKTVKSHVSNILDKLALTDRTLAAIWALKHGLGTED